MEEREIGLFLLSTTIILFVMVVAIVYVVLSYRNRRKLYVLEKKQLNEQYQREIEKAGADMQRSMMKQIGAELHDTVGQKLTLAYLQSQNLLSETNLEVLKTKLRNNANQIQESLNDIRSLSKLLNADEVLKLGFAKLIERELNYIRQSGLCNTHYSLNGTRTRLKNERSEIVVAGICREFIQNSMKHSGCKNIWFSVDSTDEHMEVSLRDDGKGMPAPGTGTNNLISNSGQGLQNMAHRAALIGANLTWTTPSGGGTGLSIIIDDANEEKKD